LIVVDDGSADSVAIADIVDRHGADLLVNERNRGPSYSRNRAAAQAESEVLAFIDSDCVASQDWLLQLSPYLCWERVGAVGGRTLGYHSRSRLDRYEAVASSLDMGGRFHVEERGPDIFYVPTCNMLVRRSVFLDLGGLREDLRVGEDVDFCWRLRAGGHYLVYAPEGMVWHKHRGTLGRMLRRRLDYGTSEAKLYSLHPEKRKSLPLEPAPLVTAALLSMAVLTRRPLLAATALLPMLWDGARRNRHLRQVEAEVAPEQVWLSVARGHLALLYFAYFHFVRYYLGPTMAAGILARGARRLAAIAVIYAGTVDYITKQPSLGYLSYLGYYLAEHVAYQTGVIAGCLREGTFGSYRVRLHRDRSLRGPAG
jgi:mycofactocin system glycosyltransferase